MTSRTRIPRLTIPRISANEKTMLLGDNNNVMELESQRKRIAAALERRVERDAMQWHLLQAFLERGVTKVEGVNVTTLFTSKLEAEQFHKLMLNAKPRKS